MPRKPLRASRSRSLAAFARTRLAARAGAGAFVLVHGLALAHAAAASDLRLGTSVVPRSESLRLVLDPDQERYTGSVAIELDVRETAPSFRLHAEEMVLERCVLRPASGGGAAQDAELQTGPQGLVTVTPRAPLAPGNWTLEIEFGNDYSTRGTGLYRMQKDGESYLFTQFQADDARQAFPCFDEPGFKIPWQLTVVVPEAQLVLANTPIESESRDAGQRTVVFRRTPPLPSYLVALACGPFETVPIPGVGVPARIVTVRGQSRLATHAVQVTPPLLAACERWFDQKYPFEKLDLIAVPEYWYGAMENPGAITFRDDILLLDPERATLAQRRTLARITAHELAHMWFGDYVTMQWWDDLWLNESFAEWLGDKVTHALFPELRVDESELTVAQGTMTGDARPSSQAIHRPVAPGDDLLQNVWTQYKKGKIVLRMAEQWVGAESFRRGVIAYLAAHPWGSATAKDLWTAIGAAAGEDVTGALATFIDQPGIPLVGIELLPDGATVRLTQERLQNSGVELEPLAWRIPVVLRYADGAEVRSQTVVLGEPVREVRLPATRPLVWVLPNAEASGYYRWRVPAAMLPRLVSDPQRLLSVRERIGFLGNLEALLGAGAVHGDEYLRTLGPFAADPEPLVVSQLANALAVAKNAFVTEDLEDEFAVYVRRTLGPAFDRYGAQAKSGEDEAVTLVRPKLFRWMGDAGRDPLVRSRAAQLAREYLANPTAVDPALAGEAIDLAAMEGDLALYEAYRVGFEAAEVPTVRAVYLSGLGSFRDPALVDEALAYALTGPLRTPEILSIAFGLLDRPAGRDRALRWATENYDAIASRVPPEFASSLAYLAGGCEPERLLQAEEFFRDPARLSPGMAIALAKVGDAVHDCARLREREGAAVAAYLGQLVGSR